MAGSSKSSKTSLTSPLISAVDREFWGGCGDADGLGLDSTAGPTFGLRLLVLGSTGGPPFVLDDLRFPWIHCSMGGHAEDTKGADVI